MILMIMVWWWWVWYDDDANDDNDDYDNDDDYNDDDYNDDDNNDDDDNDYDNYDNYDNDDDYDYYDDVDDNDDDDDDLTRSKASSKEVVVSRVPANGRDLQFLISNVFVLLICSFQFFSASDPWFYTSPIKFKYLTETLEKRRNGKIPKELKTRSSNLKQFETLKPGKNTLKQNILRPV